MAEPFIGEISVFPYNYPPLNWAWCDGQVMSVSQNERLASVLGSIYGGDGNKTFGLPNMRGRAPLHAGDKYTKPAPGLSPYKLGQLGGQAQVVLTQSQLPKHTHALMGNGSASGPSDDPTGNVFGYGRIRGTTDNDLYVPYRPDTNMDPRALAEAGGNGAHENMQPYLGLNFCIAIAGTLPSRS